MNKEQVPILVPYNPLDKKNIGESLVKAVLDSPVSALPPKDFIGAGVYIIYYKGSFPLYHPITQKNKDEFLCPIYIGKAVPKGARQGGLTTKHGNVLFNRLNEHAESIASAINLALEDFCCRFLVIDDIWIPLAESLLIDHFRPLWNCCLDGFGNHDPGIGRHNQKKSPWDSVHPGRIWADKLQPNKYSNDFFYRKINEYLR